jgi:hypothetical protein
VVVDLETHRPKATHALRDDGEAPRTELDPTHPSFHKRMLGTWFNVDLFEIAPELRRPGRVLAYAWIGEFVSNAVEIEVVAK